jgi:hypothetical protein
MALYSYIIWGINNRLVGDCSSETESHPIDMNNTNKMDLRKIGLVGVDLIHLAQDRDW